VVNLKPISNNNKKNSARVIILLRLTTDRHKHRVVSVQQQSYNAHKGLNVRIIIGIEVHTKTNLMCCKLWHGIENQAVNTWHRSQFHLIHEQRQHGRRLQQLMTDSQQQHSSHKLIRMRVAVFLIITRSSASVV